MGVTRGVRVRVGVLVFVTVGDGQRVSVGVMVRVLVGVLEGVGEIVGDGVTLGVGGIPVTVKYPEDFH